MIYPEKIKAKKADIIIKTLIGISIILAFLLLLINKVTIPRIPWAALANAGIIYIWVIVIYSVRKNVNIAGHVLLQLIALSMLAVYIDYKIGYRGWSFNIAIPIMIIVANITMLVLTIISYKKYIKYAIYQLIIVLFSMLPVVWITEHMVKNKTFSVIASSISIINLIICIALCSKEIKEAIIRKFHM